VSEKRWSTGVNNRFVREKRRTTASERAIRERVIPENALFARTRCCPFNDRLSSRLSFLFFTPNELSSLYSHRLPPLLTRVCGMRGSDHAALDWLWQGRRGHGHRVALRHMQFVQGAG